MSTRKRYALFICGMFAMALGISCLIKSTLGTSPISSVPYVLSLQYSLSIGTTTVIINMIFLLAQIVILRRKFQYVQLLQIPMTIIFALFIDLTMDLLNMIAPEMYVSQLVTVLLGVSFIALGVTLQVIGNVVMLAGEGIVNAIATQYHCDFGSTKTGFDICLVLTAAGLSWLCFGEIRGIREGTVVSAVITGSIARFFIHKLSYIDNSGQVIFRLPFTKAADTTAQNKP